MEHLMAVQIEKAGFLVDAFSNSRYVGFLIYKSKKNTQQILDKVLNQPLSRLDWKTDLQDVTEEYEDDKNNLRLHAKYKALYGRFSFDEMLTHQKSVLRAMKFNKATTNKFLKEFKPLNKTADIKEISLVDIRTEKIYTDPVLRLKTGVYWYKEAFAFLKKCKDRNDAKSSIHLLHKLEDRGIISNVKYAGIIEGYLLMLGQTTKMETAKAELVSLLIPQSIELLPPLGKKSGSYLVRETELLLAFNSKV